MSVHTKCIVLYFDNSDCFEGYIEVNSGKPFDSIIYNSFLDAFTFENFNSYNEEYWKIVIEKFELDDIDISDLMVHNIWIETILTPNPEDEFDSIFDFSKLPDGFGNLKKPRKLFNLYDRIINKTFTNYIEALKNDNELVNSLNDYRSAHFLNLRLLLFLKELSGILEILDSSKKKVKILFCQF